MMHTRRATVRWRLILSIAAALLWTAAGAAAQTATAPATTSRPAKPAKPQTVIVIENTLEAAIGQPRVNVQLVDGKRILTGKPDPLALGEDNKGAKWFTAYLDTGASGCVVCKATAERFGIQAIAGALYNEVGLHGQTSVNVSNAYTLALAGAGGSQNDQPGKSNVTLREVSLQISRDEPKGLMALAGDTNVIGMPAISKMVVEIDPSTLRTRDGGAPDVLSLGAAPTVHLHPAGVKPGSVPIRIPLVYKDFNQRTHPDNRGPLPTLAKNPLIAGIVAENGDASFTGDWLLDTGAAASIISTKQAKALGLLKEDGSPARQPDFGLPLGGLGGDSAGGEVKQASGFVIDRLKVSGVGNSTIEFRKVSVVVRDISVKLSDGVVANLDGVFGMNLLLPSASGLGAGMPSKIDRGPFDRIWIDGPGATLGLVKK